MQGTSLGQDCLVPSACFPDCGALHSIARKTLAGAPATAVVRRRNRLLQRVKPPLVQAPGCPQGGIAGEGSPADCRPPRQRAARPPVGEVLARLAARSPPACARPTSGRCGQKSRREPPRRGAAHPSAAEALARLAACLCTPHKGGIPARGVRWGRCKRKSRRGPPRRGAARPSAAEVLARLAARGLLLVHAPQGRHPNARGVRWGAVGKTAGWHGVRIENPPITRKRMEHNTVPFITLRKNTPPLSSESNEGYRVVFHALPGDWWIFNPHCGTPPASSSNRSRPQAPRWDASPLWGLHKQAAPGQRGEAKSSPARGWAAPRRSGRQPAGRPDESCARNAPLWGVHRQAAPGQLEECGPYPPKGKRLPSGAGDPHPDVRPARVRSGVGLHFAVESNCHRRARAKNCEKIDPCRRNRRLWPTQHATA